MLFIIILFITVSKSCNILSLSGGGAHGAFQAGVLNKLHKQNRKWDIITGISIGSINGMMLGMHSPENQTLGMKLIKDVWFNLTSYDVYKRQIQYCEFRNIGLLFLWKIYIQYI